MNKQLSRKTKKILGKTFPLWMVIVLTIQSSAIIGLAEYYFMKKNFNKQIAALRQTTKNPEELVQILKQEVIPQKGYKLSVKWGDIGQQLLQSGVIDENKYKELLSQDTQAQKEINKHLMSKSNDKMEINEKNSRFMVNTLWALGLVNKSKILDEGLMKTYGDKDPMRYASTGGWELGSKETSELYSSTELIKLTPEQEEIVQKIAENVYRPCCGNHTAFPDCNHGMAALGYIQLAVKQGVSEKQIYKDLLALNSFWFPQNYVDIAMYLNKQGKDWKKLDAKTLLSSQYSSAQAARQIRQSIQNVPGINVQGGGCGA